VYCACKLFIRPNPKCSIAEFEVIRARERADNGAESGCVERIAVACVSVIWSFWDLPVSTEEANGYVLAVTLVK
jgi:hypothetical protein